MGLLTRSVIRKSFGAVDVPKGVDLQVAAGEFVVFVRPSGCGSSTLLRVIAGLNEQTSGDLVAGFIGSPTMNFVAGEAAARVHATTTGEQPEHLVEDGAWTGAVSHAERLGADTVLYVDVPGAGMLTARILGDIDYAVGDRVGLTPQEGKVCRFNGDGNSIGA